MIKLTNLQLIMIFKIFSCIDFLYEFIYQICFILHTFICSFCTDLYGLIQNYHLVSYNFHLTDYTIPFKFEYILVFRN